MRTALSSSARAVPRSQQTCTTANNWTNVTACVHLQPLETFLQDSPNHRHEDITWASGIFYRIHFFQFGNFNVWGLTAGILIAVAAAAFGRKPDFQAEQPGARPFTDIWFDGRQVAYRQQ